MTAAGSRLRLSKKSHSVVARDSTEILGRRTEDACALPSLLKQEEPGATVFGVDPDGVLRGLLMGPFDRSQRSGSVSRLMTLRQK